MEGKGGGGGDLLKGRGVIIGGRGKGNICYKSENPCFRFHEIELVIFLVGAAASQQLTSSLYVLLSPLPLRSVCFISGPSNL